MRQLEYDEQYAKWLSLSLSDTCDIHLANYLAELALNWGRLEYYLYLILEAIDGTKASQWTDIYFKTNALEARINAAKEEIIVATKISYPAFETQLGEALTKFDDLRKPRNALMHGLWRRIGPKSFKLLPMRMDKTLGVLQKEIDVDVNYVSSVVIDMHNLLGRFASLGAEMLAHQWMQNHQNGNP